MGGKRMAVQLLRGRLAALARRYRVPGAQLAVHQAGETVTAEVGELEHRGGRPVTRDTAFPVGSITKSFTATAAMVLVADGDLDLDSPVNELLPELAGLRAGVTLRRLLSHTAGFAAGPASEEVAEVSPKQYLADYFRRHNLVAPPGAGFSYSNPGYVLAGRLIETVTGMSWREAVESIVLRPLGIAPAFVTEDGDAGRPVAVGHSVHLGSGRTRPVRQSLSPAEAAAGGLAVSAADLVALGAIHLGTGVPDLLAPDLAEQMRRPAPGADPCGLADGWGLGLAVFAGGAADRAGGAADRASSAAELVGGAAGLVGGAADPVGGAADPVGGAAGPVGGAAGWVGHDGNAHGTSCYLRVAPASGCAVALTSNSNTGTALWADLLAEFAPAGLPLGAAPHAWQHEPALPAPPGCAGRYANGEVEYVVAVQQGQAHLSVDGGSFAPLTCHHGLTFTNRDPVSDRQVLGGRFLVDPGTGEVDALLVGGRLARRLAQPDRTPERQLIA